MNNVNDFFNLIGVPGWITIIVIGLFLVLQIIGELCELSGKIVPEFLKIRKFFARKKKEKKEQRELLKSVAASITELHSFHTVEKINADNEWRTWVDNRIAIYDEALEKLNNIEQVVNCNTDLTLDLYITVKRNRIIDFASRVANPNAYVSKEEFKQIFKIYDEYERTIQQHNLTNGEVDISMRIIRDAYQTHLTNHTFIEDIKGYNT